MESCLCCMFGVVAHQCIEAEHSFGMYKVHVRCIVTELCVRKRKKEEEEIRNEKILIFMFVFLSFCLG